MPLLHGFVTEPPPLVELAFDAPVVPGDMPCQAAETLFRRMPPTVTSVIVRDEHTGAVGLLSRALFDLAMTGPFGYGRHLYARSAIRRLVTWNVVVLDPDASIHAAAQAAVSRSGESRYDDMLVQSADGRPRVLTTAVVLEALAKQYAFRATHDQLTGLAGRDLLFQRLEQARRSAERDGTHLALVFVDLDDFKSVNDTFGHSVGDEVLQSVARSLRQVSRPEDLVARIGGDEFVVLLHLGAETPDARALASRFARVGADCARAAVRSSVGVAVSPPGGGDADLLMREADFAMYEVKQAGGGGVRVVQLADGASDVIVEPVRDSVRQAIVDGQLRVVYQPIVAVDSGRVVSLEALVRWEHPRLGLLPPDRFLPVAEREGSLVELDAWVLRAACRDYASAMVAGDPVPDMINVNLSQASVLHARLPDIVLRIADDEGFPLSRLRLEIAEATPFEAVQHAAASIQRLRDMGVGVVFDDVGTGSTSLRHVSEIGLDGLKIDKSFVATSEDGSAGRAVVRLLLELGSGLGLKVTAEGVETPEQLRLLQELGAPFAQGYLFGRPAPRDVAYGRLTPQRGAFPPAARVPADH